MQTRGARIGFPTSAALCILTVMHREMEAFNLTRMPRHKGWIALRYVDNLITMHTVRRGRAMLPVELRAANLYGESVILEYESNFSYLGLLIVPCQNYFEIEVLVPGYHEVECASGFEPQLF